MQVLNVTQLKIEFGEDVLFDNVNFSINDHDRFAIIGPNGKGKTTLIKAILGKQDYVKGNIVFSKGVEVGYLSQEVITNLENTVEEEVLCVFQNLIEQEKILNDLENQISNNPENISLIEEYGKKQAIFSEKGGYEYHYLIKMMLSKFGFSQKDFKRKISSFSGGERTKIAFVKLLLLKPNLLIMDEPTNHLDLTTIEWLESYLKSYDGAIIFISHDRYFIENLADKIVEIDGGTSSIYKGNYSYYVEEKKLRYEQQLNAYNNQQKEIARLKRFIEFYKLKPRFVSRAKDREKKLEKMKLIDKPQQSKSMLKIKFEGSIYEGKEILRLNNCSIGYDKPLVNNINFSLYGKDRIAIMGSNGCGKSTLLEAIINHKHILNGDVDYVRNVNVGYIKQHHVDMDGSNTIIEELLNEFPALGEKELYNHLGKFNFDYDDAHKKIEVLSGGEKMRVVLAKIILENYDVLVLDEPTNHLDMVTRQALTLALNEYQGSIIFVSHDRYFVDEIATHLLYIDNNKPYFIKGNYIDLKEQESKLFIIDDNVDDKNINKEINVQFNKVEKKTKRSPLKLEEMITKVEKEIEELKKSQFLEEVYMDYKKSKEVEDKIAELEIKLNELEEEYLS